MVEITGGHKKSISVVPQPKLHKQSIIEPWVLNNIDTNDISSSKLVLSPLNRNLLALLSPLSTNSPQTPIILKKSPTIKRDKSEGRLKLPDISMEGGFLKRNKSQHSLHSHKIPSAENPSPIVKERPDVLKSLAEIITNQREAHNKETLNLKKSAKDALQFFNKKYVLAQKIVKEYEKEETVALRAAKEVKEKVVEVDSTPGRKRKESMALTSTVDIKKSLITILGAIQSALGNVANKKLLDKDLEAAADVGMLSRNNEVYKAILKLQGKIMLKFSDIFKALGVFKTLKSFADHRKDYFAKMIAYKYLGRTFQHVGNHHMAVFYYIKLLQMSWVCNQERYELLAYDLIGLQYYYLGDLERAKQFHNKMAEGRIEGQNSDLRKSGINKILLKMNEGGVQQQKRTRHVQSIQEELIEYNIPNSEDDFELPLEHKYVTKRGSNESPETGKRAIKKYFMPQKLTANKTRKGIIRVRMERDYSELYEMSHSEEQDLEILEESEKKHVYLSHLSPNRLIKNFNTKDVKDVINDYLATGNGKEGSTMGVDGKEADYVKKKLMNLKKNLELALKRIVQLEAKRQSRGNSRERRTSIMKVVLRKDRGESRSGINRVVL